MKQLLEHHRYALGVTLRRLASQPFSFFDERGGDCAGLGAAPAWCIDTHVSATADSTCVSQPCVDYLHDASGDIGTSPSCRPEYT